MFKLFVKYFLRVSWQLRSLYFSFITLFLLTALGFTIFENMPYADAVYLTFITGLTVGYGDLSPQTGIGRVLAVFVAFNGLLLTGVMVATAVQVVKILFEEKAHKLEEIVKRDH